MKPVLRILFLVGGMATTVACSTNESLPDSPPVIQFNSITKSTLGMANTKRDSVVITIGYKDADGNLGERDTTRISQIFSNQSWGNYQAHALQLINGKFSELPTAATTKLFFDLGNSVNKPIEGTIAFSQRFAYQPTSKLIQIKFQVRIRDRNLNESNTIETDTIRLPVAQ